MWAVTLKSSRILLEKEAVCLPVFSIRVTWSREHRPAVIFGREREGCIQTAEAVGFGRLMARLYNAVSATEKQC